MIVDLTDVVSELEKWKTGKGLLVHGASHTFCSGGDLKTVRAIGNSVSGEKMSSIMQKTLTKLLNLPLLSVALVEGLALGGGAELTTACDFRLMSSNAKIGFVQVKMGVISGWGGGTRLVNLVGRGTALELFSTGKILNADSALKLGLVDHIVLDNTSPVSEAMEWLKVRCHGDILLRQSIKAMVNYASSEYFHSSLNHERQLFSKLWGGPVFQEALIKNIKHKSWSLFNNSIENWNFFYYKYKIYINYYKNFPCLVFTFHFVNISINSTKLISIRNMRLYIYIYI